MGWRADLFWTVKRNAARRNIPFLLSRADFDDLLDRAEDCCMATGIPFDFAPYPGSTRRPFAPSVDRIDSSKGYTVENCRVVCVIVNLAMNEWGMDALMRVARNLVAREKELEAEARTGAVWRAAEYVTTKEFINGFGGGLSRYDLGQITRATNSYCQSEGIETVLIECETGRYYRNGQPIMGTYRAFPSSALEEVCIQLGYLGYADEASE